MTDVVVWSGPVAPFQVPGATLPGALELSVPCTGDGSPSCGQLGAAYGSIDGLLEDKGVDPASVGAVALGAFSAGGSLLKRLLMDESSRARVSAVHLADATYTASWQPDGRPPSIEGFVRYALDAVDGPHLLVATASPVANVSTVTPGAVWASGVENLQRLRSDIEQRSGRSFTPLDHFFGIEPAPQAAYQLGHVILAEYPLEPLGHQHTRIAGQVWERIIGPWVAGQGPSPPAPGDPAQPPPPGAPPPFALGKALLALTALGAGYFAARWWSA